MTVDDLLYELEDYIAAGQQIPMTKIVMLDRDRLFDFIETIRQTMVENSADSMRVAATFQRVQLAHGDDPEVLSAQQEADEIRANADEYARAVLLDVKARLERLTTSVDSGLKELKR